MIVRRSPRLSQEELAPFLFDIPADSGPFTWHSLFGNDRSVEIEVGFGKGLFLVESSQARPDVNFVGIEIIRKYQLFTATRIAKRNLTNVRLMCADARHVLAVQVPADSVQAMHVYFPDPWWKNRHVKRRLFTPEFAAACERVLVLGGRLWLISDVETYFHVMQETVAAKTKLIAEPWPESPDDAGRTNFERKYRKEGRPIYRTVYRKSDPLDGTERAIEAGIAYGLGGAP
jgi:tRNA (guanine-N7-)-methyltransferase